MKILLLNKNPIISRLVRLSAEKIGSVFEEKEEVEALDEYYDLIILDDEIKAELSEVAKHCEKLIYLSPKNVEPKAEVENLHKPFLPTELIKIIENKNISEAELIEAKNEVKEQIQAEEKEQEPSQTNKLDFNSLDFEDLATKQEANEEKQDEQQENETLSKEEIQDKDAIANEPENLAHTKNENDEDLPAKLEQDEHFDENDLDAVFKLGADEKAVESLSEQKLEDDIIKEQAQKENETEQEQDFAYTLKTDSEPENETIQTNEVKEPVFELDENKTLDKPELKEFENEAEFKENELEQMPLLQDFATNEHNDDKNESENKPYIEENQNDIIKENGNLSENLNESTNENTQDFQPFSVEEKQEEYINFDDIPSDAQFLGQNQTSQQSPEIKPELLSVEDEEFLNPQDKIKAQLEALNQMDKELNKTKFDDEYHLNEKDLTLKQDKIMDNDAIKKDLEHLSQREIQIALGEIATEAEFGRAHFVENNNAKGDEIINELSQSIAGAITSSIKDETLKAALKGMNMNINISIKFDELA